MRMSSGWCGALALLVLAGPAAAQGGEWTTCDGNDWNQRYSRLNRITTSDGAEGNSAPTRLKQGVEQFVAVACAGSDQPSYPLGGAVLVFGLRTAGK